MIKNKLISALGFIAIIISHACGSTDDKSVDSTADSSHAQRTDYSDMPTHDMNNDLMSAMNSSMDKMKNMKMSGDFDHDFALMMIEHHQGAIEMSQVEVSKGTDTAIKSMAQKIIDAQKTEIAIFNNFINNNKIVETEADGHNHLGDAMQEMVSKMSGMKMTGNIDKDFAMMMIPHHESAIKMAEDEISHGKNLELKTMAQNIINDQAREIKELQAWLDRKK